MSKKRKGTRCDSDYIPSESTENDVTSEVSHIHHILHREPKINAILHTYNQDEYNYYVKLRAKDKQCILESELKLLTYNKSDIPLRFQILNSPLDFQTKAIVIDKLMALKSMETNTGEYQKLNNWMNAFTKLPLSKYKLLPVSNNNDREEVATFLRKMHQIMDSEVYGHQKVKSQILMTFAKWISNPNAPGIVIGIQGSAGVGKTTLIKDGICKALNLPYAFIPLGGANDGSFLDGHSYTYEGSTWGKIVDSLMTTQCNNPVFVFDELDKVSSNYRGNEIYNILIHITDSTQNDHFVDKYFHDIKIDLSKCIIVFTYNDESTIHPILKDRMIKLRTNDYKHSEKVEIIEKYVIPKLLKSYNLESDVNIPRETIEHIVSCDGNTPGIRDLKRTVEILLGNINVHKLIGDASILDDNYNVTFPCIITKSMSDHYMKKLALKQCIPDSISHIYL
jgi:ATP-dependent Lon protease